MGFMKRLGGAAVTTLGFGGLLSALLVHCAEPTQIVVEVFSDACPGPGRPKKLNATNIYVGRVADIDTRPPSAVREGCENDTAIGTLTVYPSGDNQEEVAIKVVTGIDASPNACPAPLHVGCIAQRRVMRFIPNTTQRMVVNLGLACLDRTCPDGTTCADGVCTKSTDVLVNGRTRDDAATVEAGTVDATANDAAPPPDPCKGCLGTCANDLCTVDCSKVACKTGAELCAPGLRCEILCPNTGDCADARCTTTDTCAFTCGPKARACSKISCSAKNCDVHCNGTGSCRSGVVGGTQVTLNASGQATLTCTGENACDKEACNGGVCTLSCNPPYKDNKTACPGMALTRPCTGDCTKWNTPIGP
jgi:hypothetical protein